ncbi:MAG: hypothetical protein H8E12_14800 [Rhodobacteraceae bacterium]|nr:hypothetical protein [Paracoccaceae bacterium]
MKTLTKAEQKERAEFLDPKNWFYPNGIDVTITASGTLAPAPVTTEEALLFREQDMLIEGALND